MEIHVNRKKIPTWLIVAVIMAIVALANHCHADYVTAPSGLRVRERPTTDSKTLEILPFGTEIAIVDDEPIKGWVRIENGYLSREWVSSDDPMSGSSYLGNWKTTAYTWTGYRCADGSWPQSGYSAACNSLPFGSVVFVSGIGNLTITDRGPSSMPDGWLDIYMDSYSECVQYGVQYHDVYLVGDSK